jgi:hypothetical protein
MKTFKKSRTLTVVLATVLLLATVFSSCGTISSYYDIFDKNMPYGEEASYNTS